MKNKNRGGKIALALLIAGGAILLWASFALLYMSDTPVGAAFMRPGKESGAIKGLSGEISKNRKIRSGDIAAQQLTTRCLTPDYVMANNWAGQITPSTSDKLAFHHTTTQSAYIWQNDDGATVNGNTNAAAANTALTGVKIGQRLVVRFQISLTTTSFANLALTLQYDVNSDNNWLDVTQKSPIRYCSGLSGSSGQVLSSSACGSPGGTWKNGRWYENTNQATSHGGIPVDYYSEFAFVVDTKYAKANTIYCLRLYDKIAGTTDWAWSKYPALITVE